MIKIIIINIDGNAKPMIIKVVLMTVIIIVINTKMSNPNNIKKKAVMNKSTKHH